MVEPEWDEGQRALLLALAKYESDLCRCDVHPDLEASSDVKATFGTRKCSICAGRDMYERVLADSEDQARKRLGEKPSPRTPDPADGRHVTIRLGAADK